MSTFFYKYVIARSFTKGRKTALYFSRFIFRLYRSLPILLRLAIISFQSFNILYSNFYSLINFRFWLLVAHQFLQMYQVIFMLRLATEYYFINQHSSNKFIKIIFYLSEPYFRIVQMFLPTGLFGAILGREGLRLISDGVKYSCRVLDTYSSNSLESTQLNLLLKLVFDEKILFRN